MNRRTTGCNGGPQLMIASPGSILWVWVQIMWAGSLGEHQ
jgi:hypothetical protein